MEQRKPNNMFSVCTTLESGYPFAFAQLDQMARNVAQKIWLEGGSSPGIRIVDWKDEIFPAINPGTRTPEFQQIITRVVIYEKI